MCKEIVSYVYRILCPLPEPFNYSICGGSKNRVSVRPDPFSVTAGKNFLILGTMMGYGLGMMPVFLSPTLCLQWRGYCFQSHSLPPLRPFVFLIAPASYVLSM